MGTAGISSDCHKSEPRTRNLQKQLVHQRVSAHDVNGCLVQYGHCRYPRVLNSSAGGHDYGAGNSCTDGMPFVSTRKVP
ncbi:hypothetical protein CN212_00385 [Sinorhizobium meliloti]|nr:hypothetical protein CN220_04185 [Sinorhizobium meliloti]RVH36269.1 hypothetical protein CN211_11465 [Sinorhizobium meliloti]RVH54071.1 hypothetical protein CN212_00385 [Sinorhizobium meliloti]